VTRVYLLHSLLIDMTADNTTRLGGDSTCTDQIGKVFLVVGQDVRKCLVCEQFFTRRISAEHAKVVCSPIPRVRHGVRSRANIGGL
jgi:hypothetical protein